VAKIMKITKTQILKMNKKVSREIELETRIGFAAHDKPHRNCKKYNRKSQSWKRDWDFSYFKFSAKKPSIHL